MGIAGDTVIGRRRAVDVVEVGDASVAVKSSAELLP